MDAATSKGFAARWPSRKLGQVVVLMVLELPVFVAVGGLATDVAVLYFNYCKLQMATDAAVLAGTKCLPGQDNCGAVATANKYATSNGVVATDTVTGPTLSDADTTLTMSVNRVVPLHFAALVGVSSATASVTAKAHTGSAGTIYNAFPLGLQVCGPSIAVCPTTYYVGQALNFAAKKNDGTGSWVSGSGDWSAVRLNYPLNTVSVCPPPATTCMSADTGFSKVQTVMDEVNAVVSAGMVMDPSGTATSHSPDDPRAVPVPLVDWSLGGPGCKVRAT